MTAVTKDLFIEQGATFALGFNWFRESTIVTGEPGAAYDLTGAIARMQVRTSQQSSIITEASTVNGKIICGGPSGRVDIKLTAADTDLISVKGALYDLEVEMVGGDVYRLLQGKVVMSPNITQKPTDAVET